MERLTPTLVSAQESPIGVRDFRELQHAAAQLTYTDNTHPVPNGVAQSKRCVLIDHQVPLATTTAASQVLKILDGQEMRRFLSDALGKADVCVVRCQMNIMQPGDRIDGHVHRDATLSVVLSVRESAGGAHFFVEDGHKHVFHLPERCLVVSSAGTEHGVTAVQSGTRMAAVWLIR